ncbi:MAG: hypothetical protein H0T89_06095, partial [Deltaproteobacteria bacterium]|nr:hypothetical protein [Deltaproteobacteria bacterium]
MTTDRTNGIALSAPALQKLEKELSKKLGPRFVQVTSELSRRTDEATLDLLERLLVGLSDSAWAASSAAAGYVLGRSAAPGARARLVALAEATVGDESPGGVRTFVRVMHAFCAAEKPGKALPALVDAALGRAGQLGSIALSFAR